MIASNRPTQAIEPENVSPMIVPDSREPEKERILVLQPFLDFIMDGLVNVPTDMAELTEAITLFENGLGDAGREGIFPPHCNVPPLGWVCSRIAGHEGPCAAVPDSREEPPEELKKRLDDYLSTRLGEFAEQDDISLKVYYRVSPEFIAAVRSQRLEVASLTAQLDGQREQIDVARKILASGLDRDGGKWDESLHSLATLSSNGIYWRDKEIASLRSQSTEQK